MHDPDVLIQHYLEDCLTADEAAALHDLLVQDRALADRLLSHLNLDAMLRQPQPNADASTPLLSLLPTEDAPAAPLPRPRRFSFSTLTSVAALAACITLTTTWVLNSFIGDPSDEEDTSAAVAVLARGVGLQWRSQAHATGTPLSPGWLRLESGLAEIEFYNGARVTLQGPADLQLISSKEARCDRGKLSAHVPPQAKGFRIHTPQGTIVDLGTDFGLDLSSAQPQVHVFKGEIELHSADTAMLSLKEGQARALEDVSQSMPADAAAFASLSDLSTRTEETQRLQFEDWLTRSAGQNDDPALLLRLDFQDRSDTRTLRNHAKHAAEIPAASIVGCSWTQGRWPGKRALEFRNISDRVRLSIPGEVAALTLTASIRINSLDRNFNSLFMVEGFQDGAVHWQITREGKLRLGIAGRQEKRNRDYDSPPLFKPELFGQWMHLATVFDPERKAVTHYLNGQVIATVAMPEPFPLRLSVAELGNWNDTRQAVPIRHFSGALDEFTLHNRALSAQEIAQMCP